MCCRNKSEISYVLSIEKIWLIFPSNPVPGSKRRFSVSQTR